MALQLRLNRGVRTPNLHRFFSSSSDSSNGVNHTNESQFLSSNDSESNQNPNPQSQRPSYSSYFSDVKASLRQSPSPLPRRNPQSFSPSIPPPSKVASLDEIRKNLSEFRHRSSPPLPDNPSGLPSQSPSSSPSPAISLQELYKRNAMGSNENTTEGNKNEKRTFDSIRESLRQMRTQNPNNPIRPNDRWGNNNSRKVVDPSGVLSLQGLKDSLNLKPGDGGKVSSNVVMRGLETSPPSAIFGKESGEKKETDLEANAEFVKQYNYRELGEKLRVLRAKGGFSLKELNERLVRLREFEEMEMNKKGGGVSFGDLRASLVKLRTESNDNKRRSAMQRFDILGTLVGTEQYLRGPPKEHLVEKYFHPDNLSSEEKMKMELQKVRDEFKTSESDCGSSRVQVAQLTTKIKHLSSVLHKKDKHSRKGLMAMVQRRKKLLKYLRRTDWDSYCFVISKLGLRDNPDNKQGYPVSEKKKKKHVPQKKRKGKKQGASKANTNSDAPISA